MNREIEEKREARIRREQERRRREQQRNRMLLIIAVVLIVIGLVIGGLIGRTLAKKSANATILELETSLSEAEQEVEVSVTSEEEEDTIDETSWELRLVNKYNLMTEDEVIEVTEVEDGFYVDSRIVESLEEMLEACRADGIDIYIRSAFREWETQELYFNNKMEIAVDSGLSYYDAYISTMEYTALPGASEHQLGLALDLISTEYETLDEGQADTEVANWLLEHASEYGFILRYPEGKEDITGVEFEPWHYRYVGVDAATEIMDAGITLEEYLEEY